MAKVKGPNGLVFDVADSIASAMETSHMVEYVDAPAELADVPEAHTEDTAGDAPAEPASESQPKRRGRPPKATTE